MNELRPEMKKSSRLQHPRDLSEDEADRKVDRWILKCFFQTLCYQEALITAKTDVSRLHSLYEELNLTSQKLRQELEVSGKRAREQEAQIEVGTQTPSRVLDERSDISTVKTRAWPQLFRGREATLTEELVSLRKEKNELLFHKSLQEEYYPFVKDQKQNLSGKLSPPPLPTIDLEFPQRKT